MTFGQDIMREALVSLWTSRGEVLRVTALPFVILFAANIGFDSIFFEGNTGPILIVWSVIAALIYPLAFALIAVRWHRFALLGEWSTQFTPRIPRARLVSYWLHAALMTVMMGVVWTTVAAFSGFGLLGLSSMVSGDPLAIEPVFEGRFTAIGVAAALAGYFAVYWIMLRLDVGFLVPKSLGPSHHSWAAGWRATATQAKSISRVSRTFLLLCAPLIVFEVAEFQGLLVGPSMVWDMALLALDALGFVIKTMLWAAVVAVIYRTSGTASAIRQAGSVPAQVSIRKDGLLQSPRRALQKVPPGHKVGNREPLHRAVKG